MAHLSTIFANRIDPSRLGMELQVPGDTEAWYLVVAGDSASAVREISDTLAGAEISFANLTQITPSTLLRLPDRPAQACIVSGFQEWSDSDYVELDQLRTSVRDRWSILIWVAEERDVRQLVMLAPNFFAFLAPSSAAWFDGSMNSQEMERHLVQLRAQYGKTDEQVISAAEAGDLPQDADHHVWLILLGKGHLIPDSRGARP